MALYMPICDPDAYNRVKFEFKTPLNSMKSLQLILMGIQSFQMVTSELATQLSHNGIFILNR